MGLGSKHSPRLIFCPDSHRLPFPHPTPSLGLPGIIFVGTHIKLEGGSKVKGPFLETFQDGPSALGHVELWGPEKQTNKQLGPCSIQTWDGADEDGGRNLSCWLSSGLKEGE